jgi:stearoyl-CoA desaturase (delta-9 desaturase)
VSIHAIPAAAIVFGTPGRSDWMAFGAFYFVLAMGTGVGLHRYFAHGAFRTSRAFQFVLALLACTTFAEPLRFAGKHRLHHLHADTDADVHSPAQGFWLCWFASLVDDGYTDREVLMMTPDLSRFPELVRLRVWFWVPGVTVAAATWWVGGFSKFAVGYCLSLALLLNLVSTVNYFGHAIGSRPYPTRDRSTNSAIVALLTFGEGWHNNHHYWPRAARAGFQWWEIDLVYYVIVAMTRVGLVWSVREVPARVRAAGLPSR